MQCTEEVRFYLLRIACDEGQYDGEEQTKVTMDTKALYLGTVSEAPSLSVELGHYRH